MILPLIRRETDRRGIELLDLNTYHANTKLCASNKNCLVSGPPLKARGSFDDILGFGYSGFGYNTAAFEYRV